MVNPCTASYYILARASWDYAEVKAERGVDGQLRLYTLSEPSHTFIGFPGFGLVGSEEKAVLAHCNTMAAVTKMANMVQQALKGTISAYEIVNVEPTLGPLIEWHPLRDDLSSHYLYRAKLADKSVWAIDLGGAIYGNTQPLMPWTSFANKYLTATIRTIPAGCMHWASDAEMIKVRAFVKREQTANGWAKNNILSGVRKELTDKALAASMSEEHGYRDLAELMKLSNVNFETAQQHFLEQLAANFAQEIEVFLAVGGVYSKLPAMLSGTSG
nr:hypothetical protein B0A51_00719 [Rachicladosporium sp. CCFEE 5018]